MRRKQNKTTDNAVGDISAQHPEASKLLQLTTIEAKRGYPKATISDILDIASTSKTSVWPLMMQAITQAEQANTKYWWFIHRRDRRAELIWHNMPLIVDGPYAEVAVRDSEKAYVVQRLEDFLCDRTRAFLRAEWSQYFGTKETDVSVRDIRLRHKILDEPFSD